MADRIGRADYELRADQTGLVKDLNDAEDKVKASGAKVEKSAGAAGTAMKAASAAMALGFGLAAKGALEMEAAQGKFMAATGASREEAQAFAKDMNSLVGTAATVGMSFEQIAAAGTAVSQQFGVTGEDAKTLTEDILAFAKVTGSDAEQAAFQLEDTLSAFGLTADDAAGAMDKLVASNQTFGTDAGPEALAVLQGMAPSLEAMGMGLDDGIELLNAFEVAGGNASDAQKGLKTAIDNLKPGENIDTLIARIAAIEDPLLKNQAAVELFGKKAGPGLAKAIEPGMTSLDDFAVSAEDAAGVTDQAAEDMLTTGDKIRMFTEKAGAALRGFGDVIGPVGAGLGGLVSVAAALPDKLTGPIVDGLKNVWAKVGGSAVVRVAATAAGAAAGAIYGAAAGAVEYIADLVHDMWEKLMAAGPVRTAVAFAGTVAGAIYGAAAATVETLMGAMGGAWRLVGAPGSSVVLAAQAAGVTAGGAFMAGAAIGLPIAAHALAPVLRKGLEDGLGLEDKGWLHGTIVDSIVDFLSPDSSAATLLTQTGYQIGEDGAVSVGTGFTQGMSAEQAAMYAGLAAVTKRSMEAMPTAIEATAPDARVAAQVLRRATMVPLEGMPDAAEGLGRDVVADLAGALQKTSPVDAAMEAVQWAVEHPLALTRRRAEIEAWLTGDQYAAGLKSKSETVRIVTAQQGQMLIDEYNDLPGPAWTWGNKTSSAWLAGILARISSPATQTSINRAIATATRAMKAESPPKVGPLTEIDKWGENTAGAWVDGFVGSLSSGATRLGGALAGYAPAFASSVGGLSLGATGGGSTVNVGGISIPVTVNGSGDPVAIGSSVADQVRAVLDDVFANAERNARLRWSAG